MLVTAAPCMPDSSPRGARHRVQELLPDFDQRAPSDLTVTEDLRRVARLAWLICSTTSRWAVGAGR